MYYEEMTREEISKLSDEEIFDVAAGRAENHRLWHENFSGEYDDCPFQYLGASWLTREEEDILRELGRGALVGFLREKLKYRG